MKHLLIFSAIFGVTVATLPPYIKVCKKSDPDLAKCISNSVMSLRPKLENGIPELKVPAFEPLNLDEIKLKSGPSAAKINANISNLLVYGNSKFEITDLKVEIEKYKLLFRVKVPHINFIGDYDIDMNVLILKYKGQGPITGNFTDLHIDFLLRGKIVKIDGINHIQFRKFGVQLTLGHTSLFLGNLFSNQEGLGKATNEVINDNSDLFVNEIKPALESSIAEKFTEVANIICRTFSFEELLPN